MVLNVHSVNMTVSFILFLLHSGRVCVYFVRLHKFFHFMPLLLLKESDFSLLDACVYIVCFLL